MCGIKNDNISCSTASVLIFFNLSNIVGAELVVYSFNDDDDDLYATATFSTYSEGHYRKTYHLPCSIFKVL